jgi:hypothetical protein
MNPTLFKAILAMDAYNRGNAPGLSNLGGSQLGIATILNVPLPTGAAAAGFSATAYQLPDGSKVISYRGTDNFSFSATPELGAGDLGADVAIWFGATATTQQQMAIQFYKDVIGSGVDPHALSTNVSFTGHSLGGSLAGYVGGLYGKTGILFDNLTYAPNATGAYNASIPNQ